MALSGSINTNNYDGRYYQLSWTATQSIENNSSTVSWTIKAIGGDDSWYAERTLKAVINGTTVYSKTDRVERKAGTVATGKIPIAHGSDGKKTFGLSLQVACYTVAVNLTKSATAELDQIPRQATLVSAPNFTDEGNPVITYSNPAGTAVDSLMVCISFDGTNDDIAYRDVSKTETSYTFNLTDAERNVLRNGTTTSNTRTVKFYLRTVIGSTTYSSTLSKTLTIVNCDPTLSPTVVDNNSATIALTGDSSKIVRYFSNIAYTVNATALKGASIKKYSIVAGSKTGTAASGTLSAVDTGTFVFSVTDSRGNTTSKTVSKTLVEYVKLTCALSVSNPTGEGNAVVTIAGNYFNGSFGKSSNALTVQYRQKTGSGDYGDWIAVTPTITGTTYKASIPLTGLDYMTSYSFQAKANDVLMSLSAPEKTVRSTPVFDWGANDFKFNVPMNDKFGTVMSNGLTVYKPDGNDVDPDTTTDHIILTSLNTPIGGFMYIKTEFYAEKSATANRMQTAYCSSKNDVPYRRYYYNGSWSDWVPMDSRTYTAGVLFTGRYWIDGKPIYSKVRTFNVTTTGSNVSDSVTITNIDTIVDIRGTVARSNGSTFPLTYYYSSSNYHNVWITSGKLQARTSTAMTATVIIEYTKTTD